MQPSEVRIKVLVVEDDADALEDVATILRKENYEVLTAVDGMDGLNQFTDGQPEIVLSDISLPKMDGLELLQKIKKLSPSLPVILMTGYGSTEKAITALKDNAFDYIKKPIDVDYLVGIVEFASQAAIENRRRKSFPTILLADDDKTARENLAEVLIKENWHVVQAGDGEEAVKKFTDHKIDIAILDINMPRQNGIAALKKMRDISSDFESMICTGYGDEDAAIRAMREGAMGFIRKPIDIDNLIVTIEKAIEKLLLSRSLRLRNQEIDFAKQMIARITQHREIIVNLKDYVLNDMVRFAQDIVVGLGIPLLIYDESLRVSFINPKSEKASVTVMACNNDIDTVFKEAGIEVAYASIKDVLIGHVKDRFSRVHDHEILSLADGLTVTLIPLELLKGRIRDRRIVALLHKRSEKA